MQKLVNSKSRVHVQKCEIFPSLKFPFFNLSKIYSTEFFYNLLPLVWVIKNILRNKYRVTSLVFKIDTIDGKRLVKFVAMQQNRATLIHDLATMKG